MDPRSTPWVEPFDLFISYSRKDDTDVIVAALKEAIAAEHAEFAPSLL